MNRWEPVCKQKKYAAERVLNNNSVNQAETATLTWNFGAIAAVFQHLLSCLHTQGGQEEVIHGYLGKNDQVGKLWWRVVPKNEPPY